MRFSLKDLLVPLSADLRSDTADVVCAGVSTDTRTLQPGDLFVALRGANFDGHDFAGQAIRAGASALLVDEALPLAAAQLVVADTLRGYCRLASWWRLQWSGQLIAITGSAGKTTVKELLGALCSGAGATLYSEANNNNRIGVAQTLLRLRPEHEYAVVEIGTSQPGEIAAGASMAKPAMAIITNIAAAHLQGFGSLAGVAAEKAQLLHYLDSNGSAFLPLDSEYYDYLRSEAGGRRALTFSLNDERADVHASSLNCTLEGSSCKMHCRNQDLELRTNLLGRHNLLNALLASFVASELGLSAKLIQEQLRQVVGVKQRMQLVVVRGLNILVDCYNANPHSMRAALDFLQQRPERGKYLLLGDMLELGEQEVAEHVELGRYLAGVNFDFVHGLGRLAEITIAEMQRLGCGQARAYDDYAQFQIGVCDWLPRLNRQDSIILIKGSRSVGLEHILSVIERQLAALG